MTEEESRKKAEYGLGELQRQNKQLQFDLQECHGLLQQLRKAHDRYSNLVELAADAIFTGDASGNITGANQSAVVLTGYSRAEIISINISRLFSEEERQRVPLRYDLLKKGQVVQVERLLTRKDGSTVPIEMNSRMMPDGTYHSFVRDVSRRKKMEEELYYSEVKQRALADSSFEAVFLSSGGICSGQNINAEKMFGYSLEEALGRPGTEWIIPEERQRVVNKILSGDENPYETVALRKNGSSFPAEIQGRTISYGGEQVRITALRDISARRQAERDMLTIQKLESIGTLAGGIAHDFNNILTGLFGNLSLAKMYVDEKHKSYKYLDQAEKSLNRATHLTGKLLTFAKGGEPIRDEVCLDQLISEIVSFDLSGSNVKPVFEAAKDLWVADVDRGQIEQVFSNLAINARQAMPDGGHLHILLSNFGNEDGHFAELAVGKYIKVEVRDEGIGIQKKHLTRIFDPYFSTKETGRGLGLATVHSIISRHKGLISVGSEPGRGTTFRIFLPASTAPDGAAQIFTIKTADSLVRVIRVLVMDDDPVVCAIVSEMLGALDCEVVTAENGSEAMEIFLHSQESGECFDLVILDLTIPGGGGGKETVKQMLDIDPEAKVVVSSGYTDDPVMAHYQDYGFKAVITKPYTFDRLREVVCEVMKV